MEYIVYLTTNIINNKIYVGVHGTTDSTIFDGTLVYIFNTVRETRKEFPNVSKVLNGTIKHCHNYYFKYLE